jgi:hypothetical protein
VHINSDARYFNGSDILNKLMESEFSYRRRERERERKERERERCLDIQCYGHFRKIPGIIKLLENKTGHPILSIHCIVHEESLCDHFWFI